MRQTSEKTFSKVWLCAGSRSLPHVLQEAPQRDAASLFSKLLDISILNHNTQTLLCCFLQTVYTGGEKPNSPLATQIQQPQCYRGEAKPHELIRQIKGKTAGEREMKRARVHLYFLVLSWLGLEQCNTEKHTLEPVPSFCNLFAPFPQTCAS